jgi:hypothetical protein
MKQKNLERMREVDREVLIRLLKNNSNKREIWLDGDQMEKGKYMGYLDGLLKRMIQWNKQIKIKELSRRQNKEYGRIKMKYQAYQNGQNSQGILRIMVMS